MLSVCIIVWSAAPKVNHIPNVLDTVHDHLQVVADHGHTHGLEEDIFWALHGHSHDSVDHDHSPAFVQVISPISVCKEFSDRWQCPTFDLPSPLPYLIERPPRV